MLKTFMKAFAPPIPVEKVYVLLSDPETPVTPYEFWLEHKPDLLFEKPLIFLIFVVYRPHSSFQGKLEIYVTSCVLEPFNSYGDSRFKKVEIVVLGFSGTQKKKYWSSLNHLQYFLRAHNIFNFFLIKQTELRKNYFYTDSKIFFESLLLHIPYSLDLRIVPDLRFLKVTPWINRLFTSWRIQMYYIVVWNRDRSQNY